MDVQANSSDSSILARQMLSAIEAMRAAAGLTQIQFAGLAKISLRTYTRIVTAQHPCPTRYLRRLEAAARRLGDRSPSPPTETDALTRPLYRATLGHVAAAMGVDADEVVAQDHRRGATADPRYRLLAQARQATIYLLNQGVDSEAVRQRRLADMLGMTPAGVCLAIRSVEDRRDDPAFDALMRRLERHLQTTDQGSDQ